MPFLSRAIILVSKLTGYCRDLTYEWSWKRKSPGIHKDEYDKLQHTIDEGDHLTDKLTDLKKNDEDQE